MLFRFLRQLFSLSLVSVHALAADSKANWQAEWYRVVPAADREGDVIVAIYDQKPLTVETVDAFQKSFPKN